MKRLTHTLYAKRAEGYLDTVLSVMLLCFVLVFILSAVSLLLQVSRLQSAADRLCEYACEAGHTDLADYEETVRRDTGLDFSADYSGSAHLDTSTGRVQLGDAVRVTLTAEVRVFGFGNHIGIFRISASAQGLGRVYWK